MKSKKSQNTKHRPLWIKIALTSLVVFSVIFLVIMVISTKNSVQSQLEEMVSTQHLLNKTICTGIEEEIKDSEAVVSFLASEDILNKVFQEEDSSILKDYRSEMIGKCDAFYILDFQQNQAFILGREEQYYNSISSAQNKINSPHFQNSLERGRQGRSSVSSSYVDLLTMEPVFLISYPIMKGSQAIGQVSMRYNLTNLWAKIDDLSSEEGNQAYMVNQEGLVVAHSDKSRIGQLINNDLTEEAFKGSYGVDELTMDGIEYIASYGLINGRAPLALLHLHEMDTALQSVYSNLAFSIIMAIAGVLLMFLSSMILGRIFTKPVSSIVGAIQKASKTLDVEPVEVKAKDEFRLIADNFNQMIQELQEKETIKRMFGQYISSDIRDELLKGSLALEGEEKDCSILFSDIRGFTSLSERFSPKELLSILNDYFAAMIAQVDQHHGIVNKFMGDALMVLYGVPVSQGNHGIQAVESALSMLQSLKKLNQELMKTYQVELNIGIGIATGKVIAGNIGVVQRREYSVIGDIVNVASRLEKATKQVKQPIIFTNDTAELIDSKLKTKRLGRYHIRGKEASLELHSLTDEEYLKWGIQIET